MNETINTVLKDLIDNATQAKQFMLDQIPDVLHQLIVWNMAKNAFLGLFLLGAVAVCLVAMRWFYRAADKDAEAIVPAVLAACAAVFSTVWAVQFALNFIELWLAPKVWLIEYAVTLVHK